MPYEITYSNGSKATVKDRPNIPPGGSVKRLADTKPVSKPTPAPVLSKPETPKKEE